MPKTPEISVIIPVYNAADTIQNAIESVLGQSYANFELILIDDASQDNWEETLKEVSDPKVIFLKHGKNQGAAAARNTGIQNAKGEYIAFLDSDDVWLPNKLETQIKFMKNTEGRVKASCTSFALRRLNGRKQDRILSKSKNWNDILLGGCTVSPGTTLMAKRDLFLNEEVGLFSKKLRRLEDWDWLLDYIKNYKLGVIENVLAEVRVSGYPNYIVAKEAADFLKKEKEAYIRTNFGEKGVKTFKAGLEIENASTAFRNKKYTAAATHIAIASLASPKRVVQLFYRIIQKLYTADYS